MADLEASVRLGSDTEQNVINDKIIVASVKLGDDTVKNIINDKIIVASVKFNDDKKRVLSYTVFNTAIKEIYGQNKLSENDINYLAYKIWNFNRNLINEQNSIGKKLDERTKLIAGLL